jgi:hypothetical protein
VVDLFFDGRGVRDRGERHPDGARTAPAARTPRRSAAFLARGEPAGGGAQAREIASEAVAAACATSAPARAP